MEENNSSDPMTPRVSVVMCTRNRPDTIEHAVASVLATDYPAFDLTVIDQSTTGSTEDILRPLADADSRLRYLRVAEPGLSRAYNTGIARTSGDLLAFTDDDCVVPRDWLRTIVRAFDEDDEADLLYGQVIAPDHVGESDGITPALHIARPERLSRRDGYKVFGMGANFAARRRLFAAIGGFDDILGGGAPLRSSQDFDLAYRTYLAGRVTILRPEVRVVHYGTRKGRDWPMTISAYGVGDGAFYFKHVRCRDLLALRLLARQVVKHFGRYLLYRLRVRSWGEGDFAYVRSVFAGIWASFRFGVDHQTRLYVPR